jgi:hypothetical protein
MTVALCFDEYSNGGDHGVSIFYNGVSVWEELGSCGNQACDHRLSRSTVLRYQIVIFMISLLFFMQEGCEPVSLFADGQWHAVELNSNSSQAIQSTIALSFLRLVACGCSLTDGIRRCSRDLPAGDCCIAPRTEHKHQSPDRPLVDPNYLLIAPYMTLNTHAICHCL